MANKWLHGREGSQAARPVQPISILRFDILELQSTETNRNGCSRINWKRGRQTFDGLIDLFRRAFQISAPETAATMPRHGIYYKTEFQISSSDFLIRYIVDRKYFLS